MSAPENTKEHSMKFNPNRHNAAMGMTLVQAVSKNYPDEVNDYWLDSDGVHLHAIADITKKGRPDARKRPQSLLRVVATSGVWPVFQGHYVLATPENVAKLKAALVEIHEAQLRVGSAMRLRDEAVAIVLPAKPEVSA